MDKGKGHNNKKVKIPLEISSTPVLGQPETSFDLINKYGTYEIQPTSDSTNEFPYISQGNPKEDTTSFENVKKKKYK